MQTELSLLVRLSKTGLFDEFKATARDEFQDVQATIQPVGNGAHLEIRTDRYTEEEIKRTVKSIEYVESVLTNEPEQLGHA